MEKKGLGLDDAMEAFVRDRPGYGKPARAFLREFSLQELEDVQPALTLDFIRRLQDRGYTARTVHRYRQGANTFLCWLLEQALAGYDEAALREAGRAQAEILPPRRLPAPVPATDGEVLAVLAAAYAVQVPQDTMRPGGRRRHLRRLRDIALLEALRATGARPSELVALRRADLRLEVQQALAPDGRRLYFDVRAWAALVRYLGVRDGEQELPLLLWSRPLFVRHDAWVEGQFLRMRTWSVYNVIVKLRGESRITARGFRSRFARKVLEASRDPDGTAALLGVSAARFRERYQEEVARVLGGG